ncbi:hypothetical protein CFP56_039893 [Quercus suber]|uniref:Uncharacterized protein n=1 Tax=Quercus suber TaxID=58331 RepID=A0AAW0IYW5_QUESU
MKFSGNTFTPRSMAQVLEGGVWCDICQGFQQYCGVEPCGLNSYCTLGDDHYQSANCIQGYAYLD